MSKTNSTHTDIAPIEITLDDNDRAATIEELQALAPNAHAVVTDTNGSRLTLCRYDEPMTARQAIDYLSA